MTPAKRSVILIGGGGHCRACIDVIESIGQYSIAGILDVKENIGKDVSGYKITGSDDDLHLLVKQGHRFLITIGHIKKNLARKKLFDRIKDLGGSLETIISEKAYISRMANIGEGTIVMHGAVVNANARIGANNIVNTGSCIEHDVETGDHCHISTHAVINGACVLGDDVFVGSNSVLVNGISIAGGTILGAGAVVHKNIEQPGTYAGNPFRNIG